MVHCSSQMRVFADFDGRQVRNGWLPVTFAERSKLPLMPFGKKFFAHHALAAVYVVPTHCSEYLRPETTAAAMAAGARAAGCKRLTYGSSMGGYGAIACAGAVGAQRALAISPRIRWANSSRLPMQRRLLRLHQTLDLIRERVRGTLDDVDVLLLYDPFELPDRLQAAALHAEYPERIHRLAIAHGGHPVGKRLADARLLSWLVLECLSDRPLDDIRDELRARWRASSQRKALTATAFEIYARRKPLHREWAARLIARYGRAPARRRKPPPSRPANGSSR